MNRSTQRLMMAAVFTIVSTPALADNDAAPREVRRAIEERSRAFEQCYEKHDAACVVNGYYVTDDQSPVMSPPGGRAPVRGRAELIESLQKEFTLVEAIRLETIDVVAERGVAHEIGRARLMLRSGEVVVARYAVLWMKGADGWRAKVDFIAADGWKD